MAVYQNDVNVVKNALWGDEKVMVTATQRKNPALGGSVINPTTVVATDKRIIIVNRQTAGIRKDIETIPYNRIASVRLEKGVVSSSVYLRVGGFSGGDEKGFLKKGEEEGEIAGLRRSDAKALADFVNQMIVSLGAPSVTIGNFASGGPQSKQQKASASSGASSFCPKCGAQNDISSKFCTSCGAKLR